METHLLAWRMEPYCGGPMKKWAVIGAGPAGIAVVGRLLDQGISGESILWIDESFHVGDLGASWQAISSNTKVDLFIKFLDAIECVPKKTFPIHSCNPNDTCPLALIAEPLRHLSTELRKKVTAKMGTAQELSLKDNQWHIQTNFELHQVEKVVLATGAQPKQLPLSGHHVIPLEVAMDPEKLQAEITPQDTIGVFGSSHSAMCALENLINVSAPSVINFYRSPLKYALNMGDWILFDNTGLKGNSANWARQNIDGAHPPSLTRVPTNSPTYEEEVARCNKVVYAIGFKPRSLPLITPYESTTYNHTTGIIAPGLFGFGIAYPEGALDPLGNFEYRVGLWKFMDYLNRILPIWQRYPFN